MDEIDNNIDDSEIGNYIEQKKDIYVDRAENRSNLVDIILKQIDIFKVISFEDYLRKIGQKTKIPLLKEYGPSWKILRGPIRFSSLQDN